MATAGHIAAHRAEGTNKLAGGEAGDWFLAERGGKLGNSKGANLIGSGGESFLHFRSDCIPRRCHFFGRDAQDTYAGKAVELSGVAEQGAVALLAHIGHDASDGGQHGVERRAATIFEGGEEFCCLLCAAACCPDGLHSLSPGLKFCHASSYRKINIPAGAKAQRKSCCICGTTKVVP